MGQIKIHRNQLTLEENLKKGKLTVHDFEAEFYMNELNEKNPEEIQIINEILSVKLK